MLLKKLSTVKKNFVNVINNLFHKVIHFVDKKMMEIDEILQSTGMSEIEVDYLMARFLEEEAELYVECMKSIENKCEEQIYLA